MISTAAFDELWEVPVVAAPMAGGPSTVELVAAVGEAGGCGFVTAGYKTAPEFEAELRAVRKRTTRPFGVNLFVPGEPTRGLDAVNEYAWELAPEAARLGVELGKPGWDDDELLPTVDLVAAIRSRATLPVIAAGGIALPDDVAPRSPPPPSRFRAAPRPCARTSRGPRHCTRPRSSIPRSRHAAHARVHGSPRARAAEPFHARARRSSSGWQGDRSDDQP